MKIGGRCLPEGRPIMTTDRTAIQKRHRLRLTHEHTDHTWGCNTLIDKYNCKVVCSNACKSALPFQGGVYFQLYYNDADYVYHVKRVDLVTEEIEHKLIWNSHKFEFIDTPGHSDGSICILLGDKLFSGDTLMQFKPYISKRGSKMQYSDSVNRLMSLLDPLTTVYPGHGDMFLLKNYNYNILKK